MVLLYFIMLYASPLVVLFNEKGNLLFPFHCLVTRAVVMLWGKHVKGYRKPRIKSYFYIFSLDLIQTSGSIISFEEISENFRIDLLSVIIVL